MLNPLVNCNPSKLQLILIVFVFKYGYNLTSIRINGSG
jgi:hypothetical protein